MSGHLVCTATLSMSRHISMLNYVRSADTCLTQTCTVIYWLSVPAITDSANTFRVSSLKFPCCHLVSAIRFTTSRRKSHVFCVQPAILKKITILSFEQCASGRALAVELVRQNANITYRSKQCGHSGRVEFGRPACYEICRAPKVHLR